MYYVFILGLDSIIDRAPNNKKIINFLQGSYKVQHNNLRISVYLEELNLKNILEYLNSNNYVIKQSFSFTEKYLILSEQINEYFNVSNNGTQTIELFCNKLKMRNFLKEKQTQFSTIEYYHINGDEIHTFNFGTNDYIIKPISGTGSNNVSLINNKNKANIAQKYKYLNNLIIEAFIQGEEYSIEAVTFDNKHKILGITKKEINYNFVEKSHEFPAVLNSYQEHLITNAVIEFLNIVGYKQGLSHTEVKIFNDNVYIIESQPRTGGDRIVSLVRLVTGIDMISYYLHLAMNEIYTPEPIKYKKAVSFFPNIDKEGVVVKIPNNDFHIEGCDESEITVNVNDKIEEPVNSSSRHSMIVTYGDNFDSCVSIKKLFIKNILEKIEVI